MSLYCYIEDEQNIGSPESLPENWKNVSNFHLLPNEILKTYGWLPYVRVSDNKEIVIGSTKEIVNDEVVETFFTRDKTPQEIEQQTIQQNYQDTQNKWNSIRSQRDELLRQSDIYVLVDRWNTMDVNKQQEWVIYRQQLRDLPQTYTDPDSVQFPNLPN
jgi:Phage tail assembly chaperone protein